MESPTSQINLERIREEMRSRIVSAKDNAISPARFRELREQENTIQERFLERGTKDPEDEERLLEIKVEMLKACATANNLPEFRVLLEELSSAVVQPMDKNKINRWLAHENAHANVAENLGKKFLGYRILFVSDSGEIKAIPFFEYDDTENSSEEILRNDRAILMAPLAYGDGVARSDIEDFNRKTLILRRIRRKES